MSIPKCPPIGGPRCPLESSLIGGLSDAANTDNFFTEPTHIGLRNGEMMFMTNLKKIAAAGLMSAAALGLAAGVAHADVHQHKDNPTVHQHKDNPQ
jgi:hypothetical protein